MASIRLKVLLPSEVFVDTATRKVTAEAEDGEFTLLPRHVDFVAALVPGLLSYESEDGGETFLAVDEGILVKTGPDVSVSTRRAVKGPDLGSLRRTVATEFRTRNRQEQKTQTAIARLEASFIRKFLDI